MHRSLIVLLLLGLVASRAGTDTSAYFADAEPNADNTFEASWQLSQAYLYPDAGLDTTDTTYNLTPADLDRLETSDDRRYTVQNPWPDNHSDAVYLGFTFPDIPADAIVIQVLLTVEWQRGRWINAARLNLLDGLGHEQIYILTMPPTQNRDFRETVDVSGFIDTAEKVNNVEVRFQAMGSRPSTTAHDLLEIQVRYYH